MENIVDSLKFRRAFRRAKVEDLKFIIEKHHLGDFWGKTDAEVQECYQEITDKLNDMLENPCGQTSYELGEVLAENKIARTDFNLIIDMVTVYQDGIPKARKEWELEQAEILRKAQEEASKEPIVEESKGINVDETVAEPKNADTVVIEEDTEPAPKVQLEVPEFLWRNAGEPIPDDDLKKMENGLNDYLQKIQAEEASLGDQEDEFSITFDKLFGDISKVGTAREDSDDDMEIRLDGKQTDGFETEFFEPEPKENDAAPEPNDEKSPEPAGDGEAETPKLETEEEIERANQAESFNKASKPYGLIAKITETFSKNIQRLKDSQKYKSTTPRIAVKLASIFGMAKRAEAKAKEAKPKISPKPKKVSNFKAKAPKGTALNHKSKADLKKEKAIREKINLVKQLEDEIIKVYKADIEENKVELGSMQDNMVQFYLEAIRANGGTNMSQVSALREVIEKSQSLKVEQLREALRDIQTSKIRLDLKSQTSLSDEDIDRLILGNNGRTGVIFDEKQYIGIGKKGELEIAKGFPLKVEDIRGTDLERELKKFASTPKISDLTDTEVLQLAKSIRVQDGKIRVNFSYLFDGKTPGDLSWVSTKRQDKTDFATYFRTKNAVGERLNLFKNLYGTDLYVDGLENVLPDAKFGFDDAYVYDKVLRELDGYEQISLARDLDYQLVEMDRSLGEIEGADKLTRRDKKNRSVLEKIAKGKVEEVRRQEGSISSLVDKQTTENSDMLRKAAERMAEYDEISLDEAKARVNKEQENERVKRIKRLDTEQIVNESSEHLDDLR